MAASDARPLPKKNVTYRITFPILDNDGDLVAGAAGLDSEISKDAGTFVDCTNEATEIATSSGMYYLDLTAAEMNADTVALIIKTSTTDAKTTPIVLYPEEAGDIRVDVTQLGGATQSLTDLKDFADAGYDPATNKVQGVVLVDTCSVNTDMVGTDSAALASVCTETRLSELDAATGGKMANQVDVVEADTDAILVDTADMQPKLGSPAGADMSADVAAVKTDTAAILVDTGTTIPGLLPGALVGGRMDADIGAKTGNVALSTQEKADVNAETVDVLKTDTITQLAQQLPPSTPTFEEAIMYLYQFLRNKRTQTSSEIKLFAENGTTVIAKATISDDATTFTKAEFVTGP